MPDRILIVKPSSLGDVVHALPTLRALRTRYPRAHIAWLVKRQWAALLERAEGLDRVWEMGPGLLGWLSIVPRLRAERFDLVIDLQGLLRSGMMTWLTGCRRRVGFVNGREGSPLFYTDRVPVPTVEMHAVDRYLLAAAAAGAPWNGEPKFGLHPLPEDEREVDRLLDEQGIRRGAPWVAFGISARWPTKRWPVASFGAVAEALQRDAGVRAVLIGGPEDRQAARDVTAHMSVSPVDLTGETELRLLPALLSSASVLVTNDSGPMHVASAVGTPVVAVFGPTSPVRTGPYGGRHAVLARADVPCRPCFDRRCRNATPLECLSRVTPEEVLDAVRRRLTPARAIPS
jgi:lipopolysaccharide heptosyltransferase II